VAGAGGPTEESGLTYCRFDFYKMGRKAVEALREQIARPGPPVNRIHRIGFEWVEGSTCGRREA
jgi:DNA-binding LacI/PurR family transcriptional regulator